MSDTDTARQAGAAPGWLRWAAIGAIGFMALGCAMYLIEVTADPAALALDQRQVALATPAWMTAAYGVAVWVGLAGAVLLLMRRRLAEPLLLISLIAVIVQYSGILWVPALARLVPSDALLIPLIVAAVTLNIYLLARRARRSGWLR